MRQRLHAVIRGRVQGVGFRDATAQEARRLGLRGWVRNRMDGAVEVTAEGSDADLRRLETFLRHGPRMAKVTGFEAFWESGQIEAQNQDPPDDELSGDLSDGPFEIH